MNDTKPTNDLVTIAVEMAERATDERDQWKAKYEAAEQRCAELAAALAEVRTHFPLDYKCRITEIIDATAPSTILAARIEAEVAPWREKAEELAAALERSGPCPRCGGYGTEQFIEGQDCNGEMAIGERPCSCGGVDPSAILAARIEAARKEGAIAAIWGLTLYALRGTGLYPRAVEYKKAVESGEVIPWNTQPEAPEGK